MENNLFYLAGLVSGDGYMEPRRNRIDIRVTDSSFLKKLEKMFEEFNPTLDASHFRLRITSRGLVRVLAESFCIPKGCKSKSIVVPNMVLSAEEIQQEYYLAGWYDAEGWLELDSRYAPAYPRVRFGVCNQPVQQALAKMFFPLGFEVSLFSTKQQSFGIDLNGRKNFGLFFEKIPVIHSKWDLRSSALNMSPLFAHTARQVIQARS